MGLFKKRGGDPAREGKHSPMDFLLWRSIRDANDPAAWDTMLGHGRPGWHIECTVMSSELLGVPFDIHGGGNDLIFPHHECEIAQSRALDGITPAAHWLHTAPILYGGEKMSKSLGNLIFAKDLLKHYSADAIRLGLLHYHYREGGEWIPELLDEATELLARLGKSVQRASKGSAFTLLDAVRAALDDDLDTHAIVHSLEDFVGARPGDGSGKDHARHALDMLGLTLA
jgi:L-cysteine:1D-myo-inositol 2-amino-2-deoxy-alpha-D-glucopyranoside ligase